MSWTDFHLFRGALTVTYDRADVFECTELGTVSGRSHEGVSPAKEEAMSAAAVLGADHLLIDEVVTDLNERATYLNEFGQAVHVYGIAYKCSE